MRGKKFRQIGSTIPAMADLYVGIAIVCLLSVGAGWVGYALGGRGSLLVAAVTGVTIGFAVLVRSDPDRLWLAGMLPFSNFIVVGNPALPIAALIGGMLVRRNGRRWLRSTVLIAPLLAFAGFDLVRPLLAEPPALGDRWSDGVCRQTSDASCSPAAAATLLHHYGIAASETEMARLCLTSSDGTSAAGVSIKSAPHGLTPRPFHGSIDDLRNVGDPVLITVELRRGENADPRYQKLWGWIPGVSHSVVLFRFLPNDRIEIGDPDVGLETWNIDALRVLWHGDGIRLE
jgi:Peptidase C39 family